jgi:hypothetical protein
MRDREVKGEPALQVIDCITALPTSISLCSVTNKAYQGDIRVASKFLQVNEFVDWEMSNQKYTWCIFQRTGVFG